MGNAIASVVYSSLQKDNRISYSKQKKKHIDDKDKIEDNLKKLKEAIAEKEAKLRGIIR